MSTPTALARSDAALDLRRWPFVASTLALSEAALECRRWPLLKALPLVVLPLRVLAGEVFGGVTAGVRMERKMSPDTTGTSVITTPGAVWVMVAIVFADVVAVEESLGWR